MPSAVSPAAVCRLKCNHNEMQTGSVAIFLLLGEDISPLNPWCFASCGLLEITTMRGLGHVTPNPCNYLSSSSVCLCFVALAFFFLR